MSEPEDVAVTKRLLVSGRVQGVGYRAGCVRVARRLGLAGRVRNLDDGRVEVVVAGEAAVVASLVEWCREGPRGAQVRKVIVDDWAEPVDTGGFSVSHS